MKDEQPLPRYPGLPAIVDGSEAIASVETRISEVACVYPITPSTTLAAPFQAAVASGTGNLWGTPLRSIRPESEQASASDAIGAELAGSRVTTFAAGLGLVLLTEVLDVMRGKRLAVVCHVGARALTSEALDIVAGHGDVLAVADMGWGILFARNVQEATDLTAIARRVAEATDTPFIVAQDAFLTTHTLESVRLPEDDLLNEFVGDPAQRTGHDVTDPVGRPAADADRIAGELAAAMTDWTALTGRPVGAVDAYRCAGASEIVVTMGSIGDTAMAVVDHLRAQGRPVGCVAVTSFRPFPNADLLAALRRARSVGVVEWTDDPLAAATPLTREVRSALYDAAAEGVMIPRVLSFTAGLGSRTVSVSDLIAVFDRLSVHGELSVRRAVLGSREPLAAGRVGVDLRPPGSWSLHGDPIGGSWSVATTRLVATLAGGLFDTFVQAYPPHGPEKDGLPTTYDLTIAAAPVRVHAELERVDFVPLRDVSAFAFGDPLAGLVDGGTIFIQSPSVDPDTIWTSIPAAVRAEILARRLRVTSLDTAALAADHGLAPDRLVRTQAAALAGVFLRVAPFAARAGLERAALMDAVRDRLGRLLGASGGADLDSDLAVVAAAYDGLIDVTAVLGLLPDTAGAALVASHEAEGAVR